MTRSSNTSYPDGLGIDVSSAEKVAELRALVKDLLPIVREVRLRLLVLEPDAPIIADLYTLIIQAELL